MSSVERPTFQRAFVALSYVVGRRDSALLDALAAPHRETELLVQRLSTSRARAPCRGVGQGIVVRTPLRSRRGSIK